MSKAKKVAPEKDSLVAAYNELVAARKEVKVAYEALEKAKNQFEHITDNIKFEEDDGFYGDDF